MLSCHKNELNLSPSVQTTVDRVGTFRKTNRRRLSLLGIGCKAVHVNCWWGWGGRWGTGLCQRGTRGHLLTCHPHSVRWTSKRSRQMTLIILSSPVVRLGGLLSCPCRAPDAYYIKIKRWSVNVGSMYVRMLHQVRGPWVTRKNAL